MGGSSIEGRIGGRLTSFSEALSCNRTSVSRRARVFVEILIFVRHYSQLPSPSLNGVDGCEAVREPRPR